MPTTSHPPKWIKPQLMRLVDEAPTGKAGCTEAHTTLPHVGASNGNQVSRYAHRARLVPPIRRTIEAHGLLKVKPAYIDGEVCSSLRQVSAFSRQQAAIAREDRSTPLFRL